MKRHGGNATDSPASVPYAWPLGMLAVAALTWLGMWAYQHMNYTCVAFRAMCEERERLERIPEPLPASVVPIQRSGASHALQMPDKPLPEWARSAARGCPPRYRLLKGACWIRVDEVPPCPTSYEYEGTCLAPLEDRRPIGVSDLRGSP